MHKKRVQNAQKKIVDKDGKKRDKSKKAQASGFDSDLTKKVRENKILNELYDTNVYTERAMIERYTDYLYIVLKSRWDPFVKSKYDVWQRKEKGFVN